MKKLLCVVCCIGAFALAGCSSDTPEAFGKKYIEKKFENINCDLLDLDYSIKEEGESAVTVLIEGKIKYKEEVYLVKKGDDWVVGKKPAKKALTEKKDNEVTPVKKEAPVEKKAAPAHH